MKTRCCCSRLLLTLVAFVLGAEALEDITFISKPHKEVQKLTDKNFDDALSDSANGLWFLKFYAPWCGHCKKLAPVLNKVAPFMEGKMAFGKIDCTTEHKTCERFEIRGYPTLKIYRDGEFFDFPGERTADSIIDFGEKMAADAVSPVASHKAALRELAATTDDKIAFVAYDPGATGNTIEQMLASTTLLQVFKQVARKQQAHAAFGFIPPDTAAEEIAKFGAGNKAFVAKIEEGVEPEIFEQRDGEGESLVSSPFLLQFVKENNHALVTNLGAHNFRNIGALGKRMAIGVIDPGDERIGDAFLADMKKIAAAGKDDPLASEFNFCWMDGKKWERFLKQFGVSTKKIPDLFVLDYPNREFWHNRTISSSGTGGGTRKFLEGVVSGEIEARKQENNSSDDFLNKYLPLGVMVVMLLFFAGIFYVFLLPHGDEEIEGYEEEYDGGNDEISEEEEEEEDFDDDPAESKKDK